MIFSLDVIPARKGDCFILHYGSHDDPHMVLIDGGPAGVYPHLKHRLKQIREARGLDDQASLPVDLIMVSHVDADHIFGILDLTKDLRKASDAHEPHFISMQLGVWHNSFENIIKATPAKATTAFTNKFGPASMEGDAPEDLSLDVDIENPELVRSSLKVLQGMGQGAQLRKDIDVLGCNLNLFFDEGDEKLVLARKDPVPMENGLTLTVVGPMVEEVEALRKEHQKWLNELAKDSKTADDVLAAYADPSVPNASSIVVLAKVEDKTMLLTGDALGDKVLIGLEHVGLLEPGKSTHVNILKVPHHGSSNNVELDFFERIIADHYVFSGNGEHGNPERETLEMLFAARGDDEYKVHFTYEIDDIDEKREAEWKMQQAKARKKQKKYPDKKVEIRPDWSHEKQSITTFLEEHELFANKIKIVPENEPYLIDLLEEVETDVSIDDAA